MSPVSSRGHGGILALGTSMSPQNRPEAGGCAEDPWTGPRVAVGEAVRLEAECGRDQPIPETGHRPSELSRVHGTSCPARRQQCRRSGKPRQVLAGRRDPTRGLRAWGLSATWGTSVPSREGRCESPAQAHWALPWCQ